MAKENHTYQIISAILLIAVIVFAGLYFTKPILDSNNNGEYSSTNGSNQIETKTITKYVCSNGLVMDNEENCKQSSSQESEEIQNTKIESIIKDAHSNNILSLVKYESNLLTVEYRSVFSGEDYVVSDHYQVVKDIINYISILDLEPNFKITVLNEDVSLRRTSTLSWNDAQKLVNFQMSYDEWENKLTSS